MVEYYVVLLIQNKNLKIDIFKELYIEYIVI